MKQVQRINNILAASLLVAVMTVPALSFAEDNSTTNDSTTHHHKFEGKQCKGDKEGKKGKFEANRKEHMEKMRKELDITDDQQAKLKAAHESFRESHAADFEAMKAKHEQLRELSKSKGKDDPEVQALRDELKQSRQTMHEQMKAATAGILTPEQTEKMESIRAERKANWEKRKENFKEQRKQKQEGGADNS